LVVVDHPHMSCRGARTYKEFMSATRHRDKYLPIAAQADRHGIITTEPDPRTEKLIYLLTAKGIDLAPVMTEMVLWSGARRYRNQRRQTNARGQESHRGVRQRLAIAIHSVS